MRLGALLGPIADAADARWLANQARHLVDAGFESLWSAQAIGRGFMLTDPFVALAAAAAVTDSVEIGTAVVQLPLYQPADLAHRVFSLHQMCGARLTLGVGAGSTAADFRALGREHADRFARFQASVAQLRELLATGIERDADLTPWPAVQGGPRLLLGSWGRGVEQAARTYDGWIASAMHRSPAELAAAHGRYRAAGGSRAVVSTIAVTHRTDLGELKNLLDQFAAIGFDDAVVMFHPGAPAPAQVRALIAA